MHAGRLFVEGPRVKGVRELGDGIYRICAAGEARLFPTYSYLVTDGGRGVLVDPGPAGDFTATQALCRTVLPPNRLSYLILTSETPDASSSLPLWGSCGFSGRVLAHWKAGLLVRSYGESVLRELGNLEECVSFGEGRSLRFVSVPGLPTAGSVFCLDERSGSLFTGMALGSVGGGEAEEDEESSGRIESFHDLMFPALGSRPDVLEALAGLSPVRALPRNGPPVVKHLSLAAALFGSEAAAVAAEDASAAYARLIGEVNQRLADVFSATELEEVLADAEFQFDGHHLPAQDDSDPRASIERYFEAMARLKGPVWISLVRAHVTRRMEALGRPLPAAFERFGREIDRGIGGLIRDIQRIRTENIELQQSIIQASDDQLKDPLTGYYNEIFFEEYLNDLLPTDGGASLPSDSVIFIRLDGIRKLNERFGTKAGDTALKGLGLQLLGAKRSNAIFFRMNGPLFACYLQGEGKIRAVEYARELQAGVEESTRFVETVTVSAAIVELAEISAAAAETGRPYASLMKAGKERLHLLDRLGPASLCFESAITLRRSRGTVLLIEGSPFEADLLRKMLEREGLEVYAVTKGSEALAQADLHRPDVIVSEIFISQMDGFQIRQRLRASPDLKNIPFILVSRDKGESALQRAFDLGIRHFYKKPIQPAELTGIIKLLAGDSSEERRP